MTLKPETRAALAEIAALQKRPMATVAADLLDEMGPTLVRLANAGELRAACDELLKWIRAGGKVVRGLQRRRDASHLLCLEGVREGL